MLDKEKEMTLNRINDAVVSVDRDFRYTFLNDAALATHPAGREGTLGKHMLEIHPELKDTVFWKAYNEAMQSMKMTEAENYYAPMGIWFSIRAYPSSDGLTIVYANITERKVIEERIKKLNEELELKVRDRTKQLETVNKELESFSYSVSHDLRAPLRSVIGYSQMLEEDLGGKLDDANQQTLAGIKRNALRMNRLIDELLEFARFGKKELAKTTIDCASLVNQVVNDLTANEPNQTKIIVGSLPPLKADRQLITQVWVNLISNAIKYSKKKQAPLVEIGTQQRDNETIYFVRDNGAGFDMKYAEQLFGVFQRLHSVEEFDGTGVGLSIVKRIVTRHGGEVWAEAEVDRGAVFFFTIPAE